MIKRLFCMSLMFAAATAVAQTAPQPAQKLDMAKAKQTADTLCVACHGADGNSVITANPSLAGQHAAYLYKQLHEMKSWNDAPAVRANPQMIPIVADLSEADMRALAAYYEQQTLKPDVAKNRDTIEIGRHLWRAGDAARGLPACAGCHGPAGAGIPGQYPRLAGQHSDYIEVQLKAFRDVTDPTKPKSPHVRSNDPAAMMQTVATRMTDVEIKAVSDYVAGLR